MKLELGKRYIRKDGTVTDPLELSPEGGVFPFYSQGETYTETGRLLYVDQSSRDIIKEYNNSLDDRVNAIEKMILDMEEIVKKIEYNFEKLEMYLGVKNNAK